MQIFRTIAIFLGLSIEYYDYMIYMLMSTYLVQIFFPSEILNQGLIYFFYGAMAASFAKILGSIFLGYLCDKIGIKFGLSYSIIIMGLSSLAIGLLPTDQESIFFSASILVLIRFLQGAVYSVEIPSSLTYIQAKKNNTLYGALFSSLSIGYVMASFAMALMSNYYTNSEILEFAWRIPFLFGSIACLFGFILRYIVTIDFNQENKIDHKKRISDLLQSKYFIVCFKIIPLFSLPALIMIHGISCMSILNKTFNISLSSIYTVNTYSVIFSIIIAPLIGKYLFNLRKKFIQLSIFFACIYWFIYYTFTIGIEPYKVFLFFFGYQLVLSFYYVHIIEKITKIVSKFEHKTTLIAISQSLTFIVMHQFHIQLLKLSFSINYIIAAFIIIYSILTLIFKEKEIDTINLNTIKDNNENFLS